MIPPRRGPDSPPARARTCEARDWGGGHGTFWQLGSTIGMIYETMPDFGPAATPGIMRATHWVLFSEEMARRWFDMTRRNQIALWATD